jgi:outer membrane protein assembly factor BamA
VGNLLIPRLTFELPWNKWFLGGLYRLINIDARLDSSDIIPDAPGLGQQQQTAGIGIVTLFDSRDSNLWPSRGNWLDLTVSVNGEYAGGDFNYLKTAIKWAQYFPLKDSVTLVYRIDGQFVDGDAPFWDLSRIRLRGYSSGQYLDNVALTAQAEVRWNFYKRWTALAFGGGGRIADTVSEVGSSNNNLAGGAGFRFMIVEKQKLSIGIDVAYAEDAKVSVYFQVGDWLAN